MNRTACTLIGFLTGSVAGSLLTYFTLKKKMREEQEEQLIEKENELLERYSETALQKYQASDEKKPEEEKKKEKPVFKMTAEEAYHDYTAHYGDPKERFKKVEPSEDEGGMPDWEREQAEKDERSGERQEELRRGRNQPPKIISLDAYNDLPVEVEQTILYYYTGDGVVTDDMDELVPEASLLLGNTLDKFDFRNSDEDIIFVYNPSMARAFEIQKMRRSFYD